MEGHADTGKRLNVRREVRRIADDPLAGYLQRAYPDADPGGARQRYEEAYRLYFLAMQRALEQVSTTVRFRKGPYYVLKYGGKYGPRQRKLAKKYWRLVPFLELDIVTCLLQTRILLDRTIALSRRFLQGPQLPSFTSFAHHKKFFASGKRLRGHSSYAQYMIHSTSWFDVPIKFVRDKLLVHQGPRHFRSFGIPGWGAEDDLVWYFLLQGEAPLVRPEKRSASPTVIRLNVLRLSYDVESFPRWFSEYGTKALGQHP